MGVLKNLDTAIWTLIISTFFAAIGWLFKNERDKRSEVEKQLSKKKYDVYQGVIQLFIDIMNGIIAHDQLQQVEIQSRMIDLMKDMIIYGSDPVLIKFSHLRLRANEKYPMYNLKLYYELMLEIRKDMGHPRTNAGLDEMMGIFIKDYRDVKSLIENAVYVEA